MGRNITYEFVKGAFEKENYRLVSTEYVNNKQKLDYVCPRGHNGSIRFSHWNRGNRCLYCYYENKRYSIDFVRGEFEKEDYTLLTKEYKNSNQKLYYICPKGHSSSVRFYCWKQGVRCKYCSYENRRHSIDFIRKEFEKEGCILLTNMYRNCDQKLDYICSNGHKHSLSWVRWIKGVRCPYCHGFKKPYSMKFVKNAFEKENYELLTKEYKNPHQKLDYICSEGHKHSIRWYSWVQGSRCPYCKIGKVGNNIKTSINFIRKEFEKEDYKLSTTKYENVHQKLDYICPKGHKHSITWGNWKSGYRCPICFKESIIGPDNPNWKGGISCEPYCEVWVKKEFKEMIKERDNHQCQNPDCWGKDGKASVLTIHHIDYDKKNCDPDNLITLCRSCNARANKDREWHTAFYSNLLGRGNGK